MLGRPVLARPQPQVAAVAHQVGLGEVADQREPGASCRPAVPDPHGVRAGEQGERAGRATGPAPAGPAGRAWRSRRPCRRTAGPGRAPTSASSWPAVLAGRVGRGVGRHERHPDRTGDDGDRQRRGRPSGPGRTVGCENSWAHHAPRPPVRTAEEPVTAAVPWFAVAAGRGRLDPVRVLVVEDEVRLAEALQRGLRGRGLRRRPRARRRRRPAPGPRGRLRRGRARRHAARALAATGSARRCAPSRTGCRS